MKLRERPRRRIGPTWHSHEVRRRAYMTSPSWYARRRQWHAEQLTRQADHPVLCAGGCGKEWTLADDLHHVTYARLGAEYHEDLIGLCRDCHEALHTILDRSRGVHQLLRADPVGVTAQLLKGLRRDRARS